MTNLFFVVVVAVATGPGPPFGSQQAVKRTKHIKNVSLIIWIERENAISIFTIHFTSHNIRCLEKGHMMAEKEANNTQLDIGKVIKLSGQTKGKIYLFC